MKLFLPREEAVIFSRAYFKESLQLQRTDKFQTSKHLKISCQKKCFIFQNFRRPFLVIYKKIRFHPQKILTPFFLFSHFLYILCFSSSKRCRYNCTNQPFASFILKMSRFSAFFCTLRAVPVQNLQLQLHNSHFTTAN